MKTAFDTGMNRTGIATSPLDSPRTIEGAEEGGYSSAGDSGAIDEMRSQLSIGVTPVGSVPPPASLKGLAKTAMQAMKGEKAPVFIDKLGERAAFERAGVRFYEIVLAKLDAFPSWEGGPTRSDLLEIQQDELAHFGIVVDCLMKLGADPTVMTPSADIAVNLSSGVPQVLADPRTDLRQCLEGLLVAELTDNACWENLIALAQEMEQPEMAARFEHALETEEEHLVRVKGWLRAAVVAAVHADLPTSMDEAPAPM